jgi:hypothetical protein
MRYTLAAPVTNGDCKANFCFVPLHNGNKLTIRLIVTRYWGWGGVWGQGRTVGQSWVGLAVGLAALAPSAIDAATNCCNLGAHVHIQANTYRTEGKGERGRLRNLVPFKYKLL